MRSSFILFYVAEETGGGLLRGDTLRASIPSIAGGTPQGMLGAEVITSLALVPYFAFKEVGKAFGERQLHEALFTRHCMRTRAIGQNVGDTEAG
jgi:hypothetical protein